MKLGVNNNNTVFMIMKSTYACNEIEITSSEHSSVMLSSCIRFSNSIICEYKEIISHGPSSIDKTKEFVCDFMVCASDFYEKDGTLDLLYDSEEYEFSNYTVKMNEKCFVFLTLTLQHISFPQSSCHFSSTSLKTTKSTQQT